MSTPLHVKFADNLVTDRIPIKRGVRQGDTISPKLFTQALENVPKNLTRERKGINFVGNFLSHLRFSDDIILIFTYTGEFGDILREEKEALVTVDKPREDQDNESK